MQPRFIVPFFTLVGILLNRDRTVTKSVTRGS